MPFIRYSLHPQFEHQQLLSRRYGCNLYHAVDLTPTRGMQHSWDETTEIIDINSTWDTGATGDVIRAGKSELSLRPHPEVDKTER